MEPNITQILRKLSLPELEQLLDAVSNRSLRMHFEALREALLAEAFIETEGGEAMTTEPKHPTLEELVRAVKLVGPVLLLALALPAQATEITVDAAKDRKPIADEIYGLIGGEDAQLSRMGVTVRRRGGNTMSRYNWKSSATNTGGDVNFFQIKQITPVDDEITATRAAGAQQMLEIPMLGYVSRPLSTGTLHCGFAVSKYGAQMTVDPADPECGNGMDSAQQPISNDPLDTSVVANEAFATEWVAHNVTRFGQGGVRFYNLGNQPGLWHQTHRDVHPAKASYAELKAKLYSYGEAVKNADPKAQTLGPAAWGWLEYFDSAAGDRATAGVEFIPFYLRAAKDYETSKGKRVLDYLDVHVYPQATGVSAGLSTPEVKQARLRSTRILWDPQYTVESWETCCNGNGQLRILPRMKEWIAANYPGTKLAVSGYAWGAIDTPNGALAQADVLGIFGREGVDLATLEVPPAANSVGEDAFKLYRNYDGAGARFGTTSIRTTSSAPGRTDAYAAFNDQGRVTVVVINKDLTAADTVKVSFEGMGKAGKWRSFEFGGPGRLAATGSGDVADGAVTRTLAAQTAAIFEYVPQGGIPPPPNGEVGGAQPDGGYSSGPGPGGTPCGCNAGPSQVLLLLALLLPLRSRRPRAKKFTR
jgi:hypothetical protein